VLDVFSTFNLNWLHLDSGGIVRSAKWHHEMILWNIQIIFWISLQHYCAVCLMIRANITWTEFCHIFYIFSMNKSSTFYIGIRVHKLLFRLKQIVRIHFLAFCIFFSELCILRLMFVITSAKRRLMKRASTMQCIPIAPHDRLIFAACLTKNIYFSSGESLNIRIFAAPAVCEWKTGNACARTRLRGASHIVSFWLMEI